MAFGNKLATCSSSYAYGSRIINCRNKGTVFQYSAPSHVWKQWLSMRKPVDPRHSFAKVLKTCPSKYGNTSPFMTTTGKSKVTTLSKVQVQQVPNKATASGQGKGPCVHKSVYRGHTVDPVLCYNRFDPLKQFDTQELDDQMKIRLKVRQVTMSNPKSNSQNIAMYRYKMYINWYNRILIHKPSMTYIGQ